MSADLDAWAERVAADMPELTQDRLQALRRLFAGPRKAVADA